MKRVSIYTNMWEDGWFFELSANEKLVWLYLLTNPMINIAGIFRSAIASISSACHLDKEITILAMEKFVSDYKILYYDNFIYIANWHKYQILSGSAKTGADKILDELPNILKEKIETLCQHTPDTVSTQCQHTNTNTNSNIDINNINLNIKSNSDSKKKTFDWKLIMDKWNEIAAINSNIPQVMVINDNRKRKVKSRHSKGFDFIKYFPALFEKISNSRFLQGTDKKWNITFDWLFSNDTNWNKILEGNYDNKDKQFTLFKDL